jgi:hypothetical protein
MVPVLAADSKLRDTSSATPTFYWLSEHITDDVKEKVESINLAQYCGKPLCVLDEGGFVLCANDDFATIVSIPDTMRISYPFIGRFLDSPSTVLLRTAIECYGSINSNSRVHIQPCAWASVYLDATYPQDSCDWYLTKQGELFVFYGR